MSLELLFVNDRYTCSPGYSVKSQTHPYHEIVYYSNGCSGKTIIGNKEFEFGGNYIAVNRANTPHSEIHYGHGFLRYLCFNSDEFNIESGTYCSFTNLEPIFDELTIELNNRPLDCQNMIYHKLHELFICIKRLSHASAASSDPLISLKNYIDENYAQNINIHELASASGYSDSHFRLLFTKKFGISPRDYLIKKRCHKAIELLKFTQNSCAEIAALCGFYDSSQLTKMLKNNYSVSPICIRNQKTN